MDDQRRRKSTGPDPDPCNRCQCPSDFDGGAYLTVCIGQILMGFFLALLDYISRAHEIEICPSSVRPSVRLPCRNYL